MSCFRCGDCHCFAAAALFILGHFLTVVKEARLRQDGIFGKDGKVYYNDLQPMELAAAWIARFETNSINTAAILITSLAWLFFAIVMIKLAWALSAKGTKDTGSSITIAVLAIAATLAEVLSNLLYLGSRKAMLSVVSRYELNDWIRLGGSGFDNVEQDPLPEGLAGTPDAAAPDAGDRRFLQEGDDEIEKEVDDEYYGGDDVYYPDGEEPQTLEDFGDTFEDYVDHGEQDNFDFEGLARDGDDDRFRIDGGYANQDYGEDGLGWKTLELLYAVSNGMISLIDSVEFVLLAAIMVTLFLSVRRGAGFSKAWTYLGLVMAVFSLLQFFLSLAIVDEWSVVNTVEVSMVFINQVVLLPIWLIWLGIQLKDINESGIEDDVSPKETADDSGFPSSFN